MEEPYGEGPASHTGPVLTGGRPVGDRRSAWLRRPVSRIHPPVTQPRSPCPLPSPPMGRAGRLIPRHAPATGNDRGMSQVA